MKNNIMCFGESIKVNETDGFLTFGWNDGKTAYITLTDNKNNYCICKCLTEANLRQIKQIINNILKV